MLEEEFVAAERELRRDFDALNQMGEKYFLASVAPLLAQAVYLQGRHEEAEELSRVGQGAASEDDIEAQTLWRRARATVLAQRCQFVEAERLDHKAIGLIADTDGPYLQSNTLL